MPIRSRRIDSPLLRTDSKARREGDIVPSGRQVVVIPTEDIPHKTDAEKQLMTRISDIQLPGILLLADKGNADRPITLQKTNKTAGQ